MDPGMRRLAGKILGGLALVFAIFFCVRYCSESRTDPKRIGCEHAGHMRGDPSFVTCIERATKECTSGDDEAKAQCATGVGKAIFEKR